MKSLFLFVGLLREFPGVDPQRIKDCSQRIRSLIYNEKSASSIIPLVLDASSSPNLEAIKLLGHFHGGDTGNYDQCHGVLSGHGFHHCLAGSAPLDHEVGVVLSPFAAMCVPQTCSADELQNPQLKKVIDQLLFNLTTLDGNLTDVAVQQGSRYLSVLSETLACSEFLNIGFSCGDHAYPDITQNNQAIITLLVLSSLVVASLVGSCVETGSGGVREHNSYSSTFSSIFNFRQNAIKIIFTVDENKRGAFRSLDGLRVLSILWVILGHSIAQMGMVGFTNPRDVFPPFGFLHSLAAQFVFSARLAVDTFLLLSAFLLTLGTLRKLHTVSKEDIAAQREGVANPRPHKWVPLFFLNRYLRIVPVYAACLFFWWHVAPLLGSGPFWFAWDGYVDKCDRLWWSNFLFVNNIFPSNGSETDGCFYWAWYLALDFQFSVFVTCPAVVLYFNSPLLSKCCVLLALLASTSAAFIYSMQSGISANSFDGAAVIEYSRTFYTKPWYRCPPYLIGVYAALLAADWAPSNGFLHRYAQPLLLCSLVVSSLCILGPVSAYQLFPCGPLEVSSEVAACGSEWGLLHRSLFNSLTPVGWSWAIIVTAMLCSQGDGGWVGVVLEHSVWVVPARLSFGAYLLHPIILNLIVLNQADKVRLSPMVFLCFYISTVVITFGFTAVLVVLIECPLAHLVRLYTNPSKLKVDLDLAQSPKRGVWGLILRDSLPSTANLLSFHQVQASPQHLSLPAQIKPNEASSLLH